MAGIMLKKLSFYALIILGVVIVIGVFALLLWYFLVYKRRKKWDIEIYEQKKDGLCHSIGKDVLEERTKEWGTKTFYFLKKRKRIALPPPDKLVDRYGNAKEEVDYVQIERQIFPCETKMTLNYNEPEINKKVQSIYDKLINKVFNTKTKWNDKSMLHNEFIYIPIRKTLTANMEFKPIPYDVQLTIQRQKDIHDQFFAKQKGFWEKYGGAIMIVVICIILFLVVYVSYDFVNEVIKTTIGEANTVADALNNVAGGWGIEKPPS